MTGPTTCARRRKMGAAGLALALVWACNGRAQEASAPEKSAPAEAVVRAGVLPRAGANATQWEECLRRVPADQREGLLFLLAHMPDHDLRTLNAEFVLEQVEWAYRARAQMPWGASLSDALFFNEVLPYALVTESRDAWRRLLFEKLQSMVADCRTPGEAAVKLNGAIWTLFNVHYSTQRRIPDQGPLESMRSGKASCTGLSILLVDACRAVAVPARLAGIASWPQKGGNHTWVEIWDGGQWHFLGAGEPAPLNSAWFVGDAAKAVPGDPRHAIYATSYRPTGVSFPVVWQPSARYVHAVDVTARYRAAAAPRAEGLAEIRVRAFDPTTRARIKKEIVLYRGDTEIGRGFTRTETNDLNDLLTFQVPPGETYRAVWQSKGGQAESRKVEPALGTPVTLDLDLPP